jgi:hypothetical protein
MDDLLPIVRLTHVVFAVFWVGWVFVSVLILEPRLAALGPAIQKRVMGSLMPVVVPAMTVSGFVVFVTGTLLTLDMRAGRLDTMFTTGWGLMIALGAAATVAAMVVGLGGLTPTGIKLGKLGAQVGDGPPSEAQAAGIARLSRRMDVLGRLDLAFVTLALVTMPLARYI